MDNLFANAPSYTTDEIVTALVARPGARIERIVSSGHATPSDAPYRQDHDEWVLLMQGGARLWLDGTGECALTPGDHLMIPAGCIHRVTWTMQVPPTIWLAVHFA